MNIEKPDISEINIAELSDRPFPLRQDYRIAISKHAYETIYKHAKENISVEICGVLIGDIFKDADGPYLEITNVIKGEHADNKAGEVKFTHETWSHINDVKDTEFPNKRIVGWYHSHPGLGIFLSPQDMFIHKNFFNQPWQVAFVIDPVSDDEGYFVWYSGNPVRIDHFWLDGNKKTILKGIIDSQEASIRNLDAKVETVLKQSKRGLRPFHFFIGLLVLASLLIANFFEMNISFKNLRLSLMQYLQEDITPQTEEIKERLSQNDSLSFLPIKILRKGNHIWCSGEVYTYRQKELIEKEIGSIAGIESVDTQGIVVTHQYITSAGESLGKIAAKVYGNPERWKDIFQMNSEKIKVPDIIQPNIKLVLPE